jgi:hypothetical protein
MLKGALRRQSVVSRHRLSYSISKGQELQATISASLSEETCYERSIERFETELKGQTMDTVDMTVSERDGWIDRLVYGIKVYLIPGGVILNKGSCLGEAVIFSCAGSNSITDVGPGIKNP